jgi:L-ribulose-5-phosphate 4-epimerase
MSKYLFLKEKCYEANVLLPKSGLVFHTFGNVSEIDRDANVFAIKPSGVDYEKLRVEDIVIVDLENNVVEGQMNPSSDTKTHCYLYNAWNTIGGICHTHSKYAVSWAQAQLDIPILGTTHADYLTTDIPCAPPMSDELIKGNYEHNTGMQIQQHFINKKLDPKEVEMVLVGSHGPFTWGADAQKALFNSRLLEELAQMAYQTLQINPNSPRLKHALISKHHKRKHGADSYYGQGSSRNSINNKI